MGKIHVRRGGARYITKLFNGCNIKVAYTTNNNLGKLSETNNTQKLGIFEKKWSRPTDVPNMPKEVYRAN
jgi:hypothetical protein